MPANPTVKSPASATSEVSNMDEPRAAGEPSAAAAETLSTFGCDAVGAAIVGGDVETNAGVGTRSPRKGEFCPGTAEEAATPFGYCNSAEGLPSKPVTSAAKRTPSFANIKVCSGMTYFCPPSCKDHNPTSRSLSERL